MYILPISYNFNNISFTKNKKPVYAVDSNGNYVRFDSRSQAAKELNITMADIIRSCENRSHRAKGYFIINADEVEIKGDNGEISVYKSIIDKILEYRKNAKAIYAIDKEGNYIKFKNQGHAAKELGASDENVSQVISGKNDICRGYTLVKADEVERIDEHGKVVVDDVKIKEITENRFFKNAIYAIDENGNYKKFVNQTQAAKEFGVTRQNMNQAVSGKIHTCKGFAFIKASEIERINEQGKIEIDETLLQAVIKERFLKLNIFA